MTKQIITTIDFKRYDIIYNSNVQKLYKCTANNYIKPLGRSSGKSFLLTNEQLQKSPNWYVLGSFREVLYALEQKAEKDIAQIKENEANIPF